ncbi:type VI secretion system baseplate subunit TssE [Serratia sp. NA_13]|uniref:type VI secretion system baseplate subunit TssE n=1 Tax=Serratia sp. NA_13 TaxID=3415658 RepID=UPI004046CC99
MKRKPFLPCLLERLLDDEPRKQIETWDRYHFNARTMRTLIQRNIADILNTANMEDQLDKVRHRDTAASVINFGISPLVGGYATLRSWGVLEHMIREAIIRFEPRLIADSIIITLLGDTQSPACNGIIQFEIRALVKWDPQPFDLFLGARYDIETDSAGVTLYP